MRYRMWLLNINVFCWFCLTKNALLIYILVFVSGIFVRFITYPPCLSDCAVVWHMSNFCPLCTHVLSNSRPSRRVCLSNIARRHYSIRHINSIQYEVERSKELPWGTPERASAREDLAPSTVTRCCMPIRKWLLHFGVAVIYMVEVKRKNACLHDGGCKTFFHSCIVWIEYYKVSPLQAQEAKRFYSSTLHTITFSTKHTTWIHMLQGIMVDQGAIAFSVYCQVLIYDWVNYLGHSLGTNLDQAL